MGLGVGMKPRPLDKRLICDCDKCISLRLCISSVLSVVFKIKRCNVFFVRIFLGSSLASLTLNQSYSCKFANLSHMV